MSPPDPDTVVLDACLAITFGNARSLDLITNLDRFRIAIAARAAEEVLRPPAREELDAALAGNEIEAATIDLSKPEEQEKLRHFDAMPAFRGRGDAEVLALAVTRGYAVGTDERAIRRVVRKELGASHLVSTLDVLVFAIREGRISIRDGERLLSRLDVGPGYLGRLEAKGIRLRDLV